MAKAKKSATKKTSPKKSATKTFIKKPGSGKSVTAKKNKNGVKNSLVNNIRAKKEKGTSKPKSKSTVSKKAYKDMENNWGKKE